MPSSDTNRPLANFDQAIPVFKTIGQKYPANKQAALAQGEIGDCYLQLTNYAAATNAYAQVVNSTNASVAARSQAQIGIGLALEKMAVLATDTNQVALLNQAQGNYYDVFKGNNLRTDSGEEAYPFWQKEAGKDAERLAEYLQEWKTAFAYYRDMTNNWPSLQPVLENKIKKLLQEHPEAAQN